MYNWHADDGGDDLTEWISRNDEPPGDEDADSDENELAMVAASALSRCSAPTYTRKDPGEEGTNGGMG